MAETTTPRPTTVQLGLLADIAAGKVGSDDDHTVWLDLGDDDRANVSNAVWAMERQPYGWVEQLDGERIWRLTDAGRDIMQGRAADG